MKFDAAYAYMKNGHRISLPEWGGYWSWCPGCQSIHMHTRKGEMLDIRDSSNWDYTQAFMFRDDWYLVPAEFGTEHDLAVADREAQTEDKDEDKGDLRIVQVDSLEELLAVLTQLSDTN